MIYIYVNSYSLIYSNYVLIFELCYYTKFNETVFSTMSEPLLHENFENMALAGRVSFILKKLMSDRSITTTELSKETNIPYPTLAQLLQGRSVYPKINNLVAIAKYFDVTVDQLIGEQTLSSVTQIEQNLNSDSSDSPIWHSDFFSDSCNLFNKLIKDKKVNSISCELALKIIKEIYIFSLERKIKKPDKQFAEWIVNQYF